MRRYRTKPLTGNQRRSKRSPQVLTNELFKLSSSRLRTTRSKSLFARTTSTMRSNPFRPYSARISKRTKTTRHQMHAQSHETVAAASVASSAAATVCSRTQSPWFLMRISQGSVYSETQSSTKLRRILTGRAMLRPSISSSQRTGNSRNSSQACSETYSSSS
jgi:hypothetical protein